VKDEILDLLRERAALMDLTDDEVRGVYRKLDTLPLAELQRILNGDTVTELSRLAPL
jgi:hypothetical protein